MFYNLRKPLGPPARRTCSGALFVSKPVIRRRPHNPSGMIVNGANVELTKVHYYESFKRHRNVEIPTISREVFDNDLNKKIIRKNIFSHRWVLKINETENDEKKKKWKLLVYSVVFICILTAVGCGIYITLIDKFHVDRQPAPTKNFTEVPNRKQKTIIVHEEITVEGILRKLKDYEKLDLRNDEKEKYRIDRITTTKKPKKSSICNCSNDHYICLKLHDLSPPQCVLSKDLKDPSGCGGLCQINTQFCRMLDKERFIYECVNNTNILNCPERHFNCGDMCIQETKLCDGFKHCRDNSDEQNCICDLETHFHCGGNTSCIENEKWCDGKVDCWDKFDESNCNKPCQPDQVPCLSQNECVLKVQICDGIYNCRDKSDEPIACRTFTNIEE